VSDELEYGPSQIGPGGIRERQLFRPGQKAKLEQLAKRRSQRFTKFPREWEVQLARLRAGGCTYRVALHLLHKHWENGGRRITMSNKALKSQGVAPREKRRVLKLLASVGLILVEWRPKKAPFVTVKFAD
jgi:hypothetical protein